MRDIHRINFLGLTLQKTKDEVQSWRQGKIPE